MKLLFDENLSRRLVEQTQDLFPDSKHVTQVGLASGTLDQQIWEYAKQNDFAILTADKDFLALAKALGPPPKVIHLEHCDYPIRVAAEIIRANAIRISEFENNKQSILILRKP